MVENKDIDNLPRGPWLTEEEMQAILATDADAEFERLMADREAKTRAVNLWPRMKRLWPLAAASIAAVVFFAWPSVNSDSEAVAYIYGNRVDDAQVAIDIMQLTLAETLTPSISMENELNDILTP